MQKPDEPEVIIPERMGPEPHGAPPPPSPGPLPVPPLLGQLGQLWHALRQRAALAARMAAQRGPVPGRPHPSPPPSPGAPRPPGRPGGPPPGVHGVTEHVQQSSSATFRYILAGLTGAVVTGLVVSGIRTAYSYGYDAALEGGSRRRRNRKRRQRRKRNRRRHQRAQ